MTFFKTKLGISLLVGVAIAIVVIIVVAKKPTQLVTITAHRGDIREEISVTGNVTSSENVDLAFQRSGRLARVNVVTGSRIGSGQILMSLDTAELEGQRQLQQAQIDEAQAKLDQVKDGARPEDVNVLQTSLDNAKATLETAKTKISIDTAKTALNVAINALATVSDLLQTKYRSQIYAFQASDISDKKEVALFDIYDKPGMGLVDSWAFLELNSGLKGKLDAGLQSIDADAALSQTKDALIATKNTLDSLLSAISLANAIDADKLSANNANSNVLNQISAISTQQQMLITAENNVNNAQASLDLKKAPPTSFDLAIAQSQLDQAKANLAVISAQIAQNMIFSPVTGIVTAVNFKQGETVTAGVIAASVLNDSHFEVDSNVPETDIGKIAVNNPVEITIDAFSGETFTGKVSKVDPGKQIIDGVVDYKVTVVFDKPDQRLKDGLTTNLDILTQQKSNVIILPQVAILENDQGTFVNKIINGAPKQTLITIGIRAKDGSVEVISGVQDGNIVENIGVKK